MKELPSFHSEWMGNPNDLAVVGLGSNLGDSRGVLLSAFDRLAAFSDAPIARSSLWRSSPVDCPPGSPPFVNAVAVFVPTPKLTPEVLIGSLQALERECGRRAKKQINEPRPLDLDLLTRKALPVDFPWLANLRAGRPAHGLLQTNRGVGHCPAPFFVPVGRSRDA